MKKKIAILFTVASALIFLPFMMPSYATASSDGFDTDTDKTREAVKEDEEEDNSYGLDDSGFFMPIPIDWQTMNAEITAAISNPQLHNVNIRTGSAFEIPAETLRYIAGKNVTLAMQTGNAFAFSVSGKDVKNADKAFHITLIAPTIPEAVKQSVAAGDSVSRVFNIAERSPFPFHINVHMNMGAENAGRLAMLYYYDEGSKTLRIAGVFQVTESGQAMFGITHGGEYIAVISDRMTSYTVAHGDTFSHIARRHGISLGALTAANPHITDYRRIRVGQVINLPVR